MHRRHYVLGRGKGGEGGMGEEGRGGGEAVAKKCCASVGCACHFLLEAGLSSVLF